MCRPLGFTDASLQPSNAHCGSHVQESGVKAGELGSSVAAVYGNIANWPCAGLAGWHAPALFLVVVLTDSVALRQ